MANEQQTDKPPTAAEFEAAINRAIAEKNFDMVSQLQLTATLQTLRMLEQHDDKINKCGAGIVRLMQHTGLIEAKGARTAVNGANGANGTNGAQRPAAPARERKSASGEPLTPEEAAVEDMMDNAVVDNSEPAGPAIAGQGPAQPRAVQQRQAQTRAPSAPFPPGTKTVGNDGAPLTPQEIEIERMMDEAPVDNS